MDTSFATLNIDRPRAHVMLVTLNRPASANAMNSQLGTEIMTLFESLNLDADDARCIVVTGAGDRVFCAGADLKERKDMTDEAWTKQHLIYRTNGARYLGPPDPNHRRGQWGRLRGRLRELAACLRFYLCSRAFPFRTDRSHRVRVERRP